MLRHLLIPLCVRVAAVCGTCFLIACSGPAAAQPAGPITGPACTVREAATCAAWLVATGCRPSAQVCIGTGIPDTARTPACTTFPPICPPPPPCPTWRPPGVPCPPAPPCFVPPPSCPTTPSTYAPAVCECARACKSNSGCSDSTSCAAGHCRVIACNTNFDCSTLGNVCSSGTCQTVRCNSNPECGAVGGVCAGGTCRP